MKNPIYRNLTTFKITCDHYPQEIPSFVEDGSGACSYFVTQRYSQIDPETYKYKNSRRSAEDVAEELKKWEGVELCPRGIVTEASIKAEKELMGIDDDEGR
jgi:hypothetical protein